MIRFLFALLSIFVSLESVGGVITTSDTSVSTSIGSAQRCDATPRGHYCRQNDGYSWESTLSFNPGPTMASQFLSGRLENFDGSFGILESAMLTVNFSYDTTFYAAANHGEVGAWDGVAGVGSVGRTFFLGDQTAYNSKHMDGINADSFSADCQAYGSSWCNDSDSSSGSLTSTYDLFDWYSVDELINSTITMTLANIAWADVTGCNIISICTAAYNGNTFGASASIAYVYTDFPVVVPTPTVSVPEPSSIALLGLGLFGMGVLRRKSHV